MPEEALTLLGDASWTRSTGRNVSERSSPTQNTHVTNSVGTVTKSLNSYQAADLCDQLNLTPRQKQMCVQGGEGLAETLLEGQSLIRTFDYASYLSKITSICS